MIVESVHYVYLLKDYLGCQAIKNVEWQKHANAMYIVYSIQYTENSPVYQMEDTLPQSEGLVTASVNW